VPGTAEGVCLAPGCELAYGSRDTAAIAALMTLQPALRRSCHVTVFHGFQPKP
jgi:hypothetical protein